MIGSNTGSSGEITVTGEGSELLSASDLVVGNAGRGTLNINAGGYTRAIDAVVGRSAGGTGAIKVSGADSRFASVTLNVGGAGSGQVEVLAGGRVSTETAYIGANASGVGVVTISGAGSSWQSSGLFQVGGEGTGTLNILNGGQVTAAGSRIDSGGRALVSGQGALWQSNFEIKVDGRLDIENGGVVTADYTRMSADINISGAGSEFRLANNLDVGRGSSATLTITNGGKAIVGNATIGYLVSGTGRVNVSGAGSAFEVTGPSVSIAANGSGVVRLSDGGLLRIGQGTGTMNFGLNPPDRGSLIIGAEIGNEAAKAGRVEVGTLNFRHSQALVVFNHTDTDFVLSSRMTGNGTLRQVSGTTSLTGDSSGFTGTLYVTGGNLNVGGVLGGATNVTGGILAGSGRIGNLVLGAGGILAPGNSVGTLTVSGNAVFETGSTYRVEVDPAGTAADLLAVTGTLTINGVAVQHVGPASGYSGIGRYQIITAAGGISGAGFDNVGTDFAFLNADLEYDSTSVYLTLERNAVPFPAVGVTPNQRSTALAAENTGVDAPLYKAILPLDEDEARKAFDTLSGEGHGSIRTALIEQAQDVRTLAGQRARLIDRSERGVQFWSAARGQRGEHATDGNAASLDYESVGGWIGVDAVTASSLTFGIAGGSERADYRIGDRATSGTGDSYGLSVYGSGLWGGFGVSVGAAGSWEEIKTRRSAAFQDFAEQLQGQYDARTTQYFAEARYRLSLGENYVEPFATIARVQSKTDAFGEWGGSAALNVDSSTQEVSFLTLGVGGQRVVELRDGARAVLEGRLGWRGASGDLDSANNHQFGVGREFAVLGTGIEDSVLVAEINGTARLTSRASAFAGWSAQVGDRLETHGLTAGIRFQF